MIITDSPCEILRAFIIAEGYMFEVSNDSWPLYISSLPDGLINNIGAIFDTSPIKHGKLMRGDFIQHPGIQLRIRSVDFALGWSKINEITTAMDIVHNEIQTLNTTDYLIQNITKRSGPVFMGTEPGTKRRYMFSVNWTIAVKEN